MSNNPQSLVVARSSAVQVPQFLAGNRPFPLGTFGQTSPIDFNGSRVGDIVDRVEDLKIPLSPSAMATKRGTANHRERSISEQLFDATAEVKILTSQVAMHFENAWRERLFRQLDRLHDVEEWDEEDRPVDRGSFSTFLKAICDLKPAVRPGLGLSNRGDLIAAWTNGKNRLTLQFMPRERVKWVISKWVDEELDQVAGDTPVQRLSSALAPYGTNEWFSH
jgi:hypothetical protein